MFHLDLVGCVLNGLDAEYLLITTILVKQEPSWIELHVNLLSFEARLKQVQELSSNLSCLTTSPVVNAAFVKNQGFRNKNQENNSCGLGGGHGGSQGYKSKGHGRGRGRGNNRPMSRICGRTGHVTTICYYQSDYAYMGSTPQHGQHSSQISPPSQYRPPAVLVNAPNAFFTSRGSNCACQSP
ncbi:hypothetical protein Syun_009382 [Stephania yunnanensis]|uniref:Uncharacterized protein n=1 Tax=Stephania yunnanensis TaxID=152371 RepID=A0AAP0PNH0_9MAGN